MSSFQEYSWLLFTPTILTTKLSNVWRDVNMRTSNSSLCHMYVLAFVLMLRPFFPELVISTDLLSFEHPSVLLFCLALELIRSVPNRRRHILGSLCGPTSHVTFCHLFSSPLKLFCERHVSLVLCDVTLCHFGAFRPYILFLVNSVQAPCFPKIQFLTT